MNQASQADSFSDRQVAQSIEYLDPDRETFAQRPSDEYVWYAIQYLETAIPAEEQEKKGPCKGSDEDLSARDLLLWMLVLGVYLLTPFVLLVLWRTFLH